MRNSPRDVKKLGRLDGPKSWLWEKFLKPASQGLKFKRFLSLLALRGSSLVLRGKLPSLERHGRQRVDGDARPGSIGTPTLRGLPVLAEP
jgi:hypothetical protein